MKGLTVNHQREIKKELLAYEQELKKRIYKNNPIRWIKELCYIKLEGGGIDKFNLYDYQEEFVDKIWKLVKSKRKAKKFIVLKARQMGFSWVNAAMMLYVATYYENVDLLIMSRTEEDAIQQLGRIKFMHDNLPTEYRYRLIIKNATKLKFANNTTIHSLSGGEDSGRGYTSFLTLWDEAALSQYDSNIRSAIEPATNKGTFIVQSTPKGMGGEFYNMWKDDYFEKFYCDWTRHPERDEEWALANGWKSEKKHLRMKFDEEYGCSFCGSVMNVFDIDIIEELKKKVEKPLRITREGVKIYREVVTNDRYAMGVDVAEGLIRGDYSTIVVMSKTTNEIVAVFRERINFDNFTKVIIDIAYKYNKALIGVEKNNHGHVILNKLKETNLPLFYMKKYDNYTKQWTSSVGWQTNGKTKPLMIDLLEEKVRNKDIGILDYNILDELSTYIYEETGNREKMNAMGDAHDDLIIALAICLEVLKDVKGTNVRSVKKEHTEFDELKKRMDKIKQGKGNRRFIKSIYY